MKIRQIQNDTVSEILAGPGCPVLVDPTWIEIQGEGMSYFEVSNGSTVLAYLSAYTYKKFGKPFLITPPGFPYCGLKVLNASSHDNDSRLFYENLSAAIEAFLSDNFSRYAIDLSFPPEIASQAPFSDKAYAVNDRTTYLLDLSQPVDALMRGLSGNRKRNVKSQSKGYEVTISALNPGVPKLLDFTLRKSGDTQMRPVYEKLVAKSAFPFVKGITVSKGKAEIAGGLFVYDSDACYYFAGGFDPEAKDHNAGTLCLWSAIIQAKADGCSVFNFCGSSISSIENYFKSFGAEKTQYLRVKKGMALIDSMKKIKGKLLN